MPVFVLNTVSLKTLNERTWNNFGWNANETMALMPIAVAISRMNFCGIIGMILKKEEKIAKTNPLKIPMPPVTKSLEKNCNFLGTWRTKRIKW